MKRFYVFLLSLFLSLSAMLLPWGFFVFKDDSAKEIILPQKISFEINILISLREDDVTLSYFILNLKNEKIDIYLIPPDTLSEDLGENIPLFKIEDNGGLKYAAKSLNKRGIKEIENYSKISLKELSEILDIMGSCDFIFKEDIFTDSKMLLFKKGRLLAGKEEALLILKEDTDLSFSKKFDLFSDLTAKILSEGKNLKEYQKEEIFNILANSSDSNLSINDFLEFKKLSLFNENFKAEFKGIFL